MDEKIWTVITKLNDLRNKLDPEEQRILDLIVKASDDDEVEAHRFDLKITPRIDLKIENQMYKVIEK